MKKLLQVLSFVALMAVVATPQAAKADTNVYFSVGGPARPYYRPAPPPVHYGRVAYVQPHQVYRQPDYRRHHGRHNSHRDARYYGYHQRGYHSQPVVYSSGWFW